MYLVLCQGNSEDGWSFPIEDFVTCVPLLLVSSLVMIVDERHDQLLRQAVDRHLRTTKYLQVPRLYGISPTQNSCQNYRLPASCSLGNPRLLSSSVLNSV